MRRSGPKEWTPPAHLLAQYDRAELYEKVWSEPMRILAQQYGVSDVSSRKGMQVASGTASRPRLLGKEEHRKTHEETPAMAFAAGKLRDAKTKLERHGQAPQRR